MSTLRRFHVVDVNSGNRTKNANGQEGNALEVNLGAADELARQLRLRDMGGIIVVDFIDMNEAENRQKLYERMCANMQKDRARHNILPLSKFGLMQITRQRVRPAMDVNTTEICPTCFGKGTIKSSILFTDTLESKIDYLVNKLKVKKFLVTRPSVCRRLHQSGTRFPQTEVADEIRIRYQDHSKSETRFSCNMCSTIHMERKSI